MSKRLSFLSALLVVAIVAVMSATPSQAEASGALPNLSPSALVIDGTAIPITDAPWQVFVSSVSGNCGGMLLAPNLVLTAAHCVDTVNDGLDVYIVAGSSTANDVAGGQASYATNVIVHPDYVNGNFLNPAKNDVALIELASPVTFGTGAAPIALATPTEVTNAVGGNASITGWGLTAAPSPGQSAPADLQGGTVALPGDMACAFEVGAAYDQSVEICSTALDSGQSVCRGDSGGPLVIDAGGTPKLAGIASWASLACEDYGVFARVTAFADWISNNSPPAVTATTTTLEGTLFDDVNGDGIQDPGDGGVGNQTVEIQQYVPGSSTTFPPVSTNVTTDANGNYTFTGPAGWYRVVFSKPSGTFFTLPDVGSNDSVDSDVANQQRGRTDPLPVGASGADLDAGITSGTTISGVVFEDVNENGVRDPGEPVVTPAMFTDTVQYLQGGSFVNSDFVNADGTYSFELGPGSDWVLRYRPDGDPVLTALDVGDDDTIDNDFDPVTLRTEPFTVEAGNDLVFDIGLVPDPASYPGGQEAGSTIFPARPAQPAQTSSTHAMRALIVMTVLLTATIAGRFMLRRQPR